MWAIGAVNAFSLELIRRWTPETLVPLQQHHCTPSGEAETWQRMQNWLDRASGHDPQAAMHRGALACLEGDGERTGAVWYNSSKSDA